VVVLRHNPKYYAGLLSLVNVDHILSLSTGRAPEIRLLREGREIPLEALGTGWMLGSAGVLESLYAEYRRGSTILLQFLHERWEPLRHLCWSLAAEFSAFLQVNVYLTPAKAQGLKTHYDTHDVFVLQTEGSKHWRLYQGPIPLPVRGQMYEEVDLQQGDLIYIPRGLMHDAVSADSMSLHLTVGVNTFTWAALLLRAVESLIQRDPRLRESLPPGFASNEDLRKQAEAHLSELSAIIADQIEPEL
jgi:ribosomal protein L16 Arg81 hydroxylase